MCNMRNLRLFPIMQGLSFILETTAFIPNLVASRRRQAPLVIARDAVCVKPSSDHTSTPSSATLARPGLLLDIPMKRLKLPMFTVGREYVVVPLKIDGQGPFEFMLDTGATIELISPQLRHHLEIDSNANEPPGGIEGLAAGGKTTKESVVEVAGASICGQDKELKLPTLRAAVTHFAQERIDPKHRVDGMLGMEMLRLFDVDLDFPAGRVRFWTPGTAAKEAKRSGLVEIPTVVVNESLVLGTRVTGKPSAQKRSKPGTSKSKQPFIGIIDSGSTFSTVNWEAAKYLDLAPKTQIINYLGSPGIMAVGIDNKPLYVPTKKVELTFCGEAMKNKNGVIGEFVAPPPKWQPWKPVLAGIADLPIFKLLLGRDNEPFHLPAAIIGLDVLSQRRVILEGGIDMSERHRRMFVSPQ